MDLHRLVLLLYWVGQFAPIFTFTAAPPAASLPREERGVGGLLLILKSYSEKISIEDVFVHSNVFL